MKEIRKKNYTNRLLPDLNNSISECEFQSSENDPMDTSFAFSNDGSQEFNEETFVPKNVSDLEDFINNYTQNLYDTDSPQHLYKGKK